MVAPGHGQPPTASVAGARWGESDERGALNLLDADTVLAAVRTCRTGKVYNLGLPVQREGIPFFDYRGPSQRLTLTSRTDEDRFMEFGGEVGVGANEDVLILPAHNGTHMDALCHVYVDHHLFNGHDQDSFSSYGGAARCGIEKAGGFASRAVLLDLPTHENTRWLEPGRLITSDDLEAARAAQGVEIRRGDVLVIRTGWLDLYDALEPGESLPMEQPGVGLAALPFIRDHDVVAVGSDNAAVEVMPFDTGVFLKVHIELLVHSGIYLLEHLRLRQLVADNVREMLLVVAPLLITGGTGSPVNPIAIA